jgi:hypothetical protein
MNRVVLVQSLVPGSDDLSAPSEQVRFGARALAYATVFVAALVLRLLYLGPASAELYGVEQERYRIAHFYHEASASLADGDDRVLFPRVVSRADTLAAGYPPGYFAFMGAVYRVAGEDMRFVLFTQCVLDALGAVLLVLLGELLFSPPVGAVAGMLVAISPQFCYLSLVIKPDTLVFLPVAMAVALIVIGLRRNKLKWFVGAGVALGLACWLRQNALLLAPVLAACALVAGSPRRVWRESFALIAVCFAFVMPITIRNAMNYGAFVPVTFGDGFALVSGLARDDYAHRYNLPRFAYNVSVDEAVERGLDSEEYFREYDAFQSAHARKFDSKHTVLSVFDVDGIDRDRARRRKAIGLIMNEPGYFASIYLRRVGRLLGFTEQLRPVPAASRPIERRMESQAFYADLRARKVWEDRYGSRSDHVRALLATAQKPFRTGVILTLAMLGLLLAAASGWRRPLVLLAIPIYYICLQSLMWAEFRHTLPAHIATFLFVSVALVGLCRLAATGIRTLVSRGTREQSN